MKARPAVDQDRQEAPAVYVVPEEVPEAAVNQALPYVAGIAGAAAGGAGLLIYKKRKQ